MNLRCFVILMCGLCLAAGGDKKGEGKKDLEKLKATWKATSGEASGMNLPDEFVKSAVFSVDGSKYTFKAEGLEDEEGTLKVDTSKTPNTMDISITKGMQKGMEQKAIYELSGDTLKICFSQPGEERPKDFVTKDGENTIVLVFKREKK